MAERTEYRLREERATNGCRRLVEGFEPRACALGASTCLTVATARVQHRRCLSFPSAQLPELDAWLSISWIWCYKGV